MEQPSSSPIALVLGLPLVAIALAVVFAYFMTGDEKPNAPVETAPTQFAAPPEQTPIPPAATPRAAPSAQPAPSAAPAPEFARRPPPGYDAAAQAAQALQDPRVQEHAQLMATESARVMIQQANLDGLRRLRETLRDPRVANVISATDVEAMDVAIDCLAHASGFRQRADDFLDDHPSSPLTESVRGACK